MVQRWSLHSFEHVSCVGCPPFALLDSASFCRRSAALEPIARDLSPIAEMTAVAPAAVAAPSPCLAVSCLCTLPRCWRHDAHAQACQALGVHGCLHKQQSLMASTACALPVGKNRSAEAQLLLQRDPWLVCLLHASHHCVIQPVKVAALTHNQAYSAYFHAKHAGPSPTLQRQQLAGESRSMCPCCST